MTNETPNQRTELDAPLIQVPELELQSENPIQTEQSTNQIDPAENITQVPNPKKKDKKILLLSILGVFLVVILVLSAIASTIARQRLQNPSVAQPIPTQIPITPINSPEIDPIWKQKIDPVKQELNTIKLLQTSNEFLPPSIDTEIGIQ